MSTQREISKLKRASKQRGRIAKIGKQFTDLKDLVFGMEHHKKLSKANILSASLDYIKNLQATSHKNKTCDAETNTLHNNCQYEQYGNQVQSEEQYNPYFTTGICSTENDDQVHYEQNEESWITQENYTQQNHNQQNEHCWISHENKKQKMNPYFTDNDEEYWIRQDNSTQQMLPYFNLDQTDIVKWST